MARRKADCNVSMFLFFYFVSIDRDHNLLAVPQNITYTVLTRGNSLPSNSYIFNLPIFNL